MRPGATHFIPAFERVKVLPFLVEKTERTTERGRARLDITGMVSTEQEDHEREIIHAGFFDKSLDQFQRRGTMRWMHEPGDVQGRWTKVSAVPGQGYYAEGYMVHLGSDDIDGRRFAMVEEGLINSASVGFNGRYDGDHGFTTRTGVGYGPRTAYSWRYPWSISHATRVRRSRWQRPSASSRPTHPMKAGLTHYSAHPPHERRDAQMHDGVSGSSIPQLRPETTPEIGRAHV